MKPNTQWIPHPSEIEKTNLWPFMKALQFGDYSSFHKWTAQNRELFWQKVISQLDIQFKKPYSQILNTEEGTERAKWLFGAKLNISDSCFRADPQKTALISKRPSEKAFHWTYQKLEELSNQVANGLTSLGYKKGAPIAIDMLMTAESVAIYLGILKMGGTVVSIADSFSTKEIETRLRIAKAKAIFTQDFFIRSGKKIDLYNKVKESNPEQIFIVPFEREKQSLTQKREKDFEWSYFLNQSTHFNAVTCDPNDPINILFSSGTTAEPKAIPWDHTTPIKCAMDGYFHQDIQKKDVVMWPTNLGWMMGPWLIFASLINKSSLALFEDAAVGREFGEFISNANVTILGLVPSLVKNWRETKCMEGLNWEHIKCFSSTGECSNAEDYSYLMELAKGRPVIEYCGGTEIGGGYITATLLQPAIPATFTTAALGLDFVILDEMGKKSRAGELFIIPPSIGLSTTLLNKDHHEVYYKDTPLGPHGELLRRHGDEMEVLENGYFRGLGRADDAMNLGGIKVSSAEIERILNTVEYVVETAAIAKNPEGGGPSQLIIFSVTKKQIDKDDLKKKMQKKLSADLNPLFKIEEVILIDALPRTASNKVMRRVLRDSIQNS